MNQGELERVFLRMCSLRVASERARAAGFWFFFFFFSSFTTYASFQTFFVRQSFRIYLFQLRGLNSLHIIVKALSIASTKFQDWLPTRVIVEKINMKKQVLCIGSYRKQTRFTQQKLTCINWNLALYEMCYEFPRESRFSKKIKNDVPGHSDGIYSL